MNYILILILIAVLNLKANATTALVLGFGEPAFVAALSYFLPSLVVSLTVIYFSIQGSRLGKRGWFSIPIILSILAVIPGLVLLLNM